MYVQQVITAHSISYLLSLRSLALKYFLIVSPHCYYLVPNASSWGQIVKLPKPNMQQSAGPLCGCLLTIPSQVLEEAHGLGMDAHHQVCVCFLPWHHSLSKNVISDTPALFYVKSYKDSIARCHQFLWEAS